LAIEAAYTAGIAQIESAVGQWQARVGDGKVVGKFGDRVQQLISSVRKAYSTRTAGKYFPFTSYFSFRSYTSHPFTSLIIYIFHFHRHS